MLWIDETACQFQGNGTKVGRDEFLKIAKEKSVIIVCEEVNIILRARFLWAFMQQFTPWAR